MSTAVGHEAVWLDFGRLRVADYVLRSDDDDAGSDDTGVAPDEAELVERAARATEYLALMQSRFESSLAEESAFSIIAANAGLTTFDAAVLAIVLAVEVDPALARLLAQDG